MSKTYGQELYSPIVPPAYEPEALSTRPSQQWMRVETLQKKTNKDYSEQNMEGSDPLKCYIGEIKYSKYVQQNIKLIRIISTQFIDFSQLHLQLNYHIMYI